MNTLYVDHSMALYMLVIIQHHDDRGLYTNCAHHRKVKIKTLHMTMKLRADESQATSIILIMILIKSIDAN